MVEKSTNDDCVVSVATRWRLQFHPIPLLIAVTLPAVVFGFLGQLAAIPPKTGVPVDDSYLAPPGLRNLCKLDTSFSVFNVKTRYGAVGNGLADDTVAIRNAMAAAVAAGGGIIYFPAGTYAVCPQYGDTANGGNQLGRDVISINTSTDLLTITPGNIMSSWSSSLNAAIYVTAMSVYLRSSTASDGDATLPTSTPQIALEMPHLYHLGLGHHYRFRTSAGTTPAAGECNVDQSALARATNLYINKTDSDGVDQTTALNYLKTNGGRVALTEPITSASSAGVAPANSFHLTIAAGAGRLHGNVYAFPINRVVKHPSSWSGATFPDNDAIRVCNFSGNTAYLFATIADALAGTNRITFRTSGKHLAIVQPSTGAIFNIKSSNLIFIGDHDPSPPHAPKSIIKSYVAGLSNPAKVWIANGSSGYGISRFFTFRVDPSAAAGPIDSLQWRSLELDGGSGWTTNNVGSGGGNPIDGTGWDVNHKAWCIGGNKKVDKTLAFNCLAHKYKGEIWMGVGGNNMGNQSLVLTTIKDANSSAISTAGTILFANGQVGGDNAGDNVLNGFECFLFGNRTGQQQRDSLTVQDSLIQCIPTGGTIGGNGVCPIGDAGSSLNLLRNTIKGCRIGVLCSEGTHNALIDGNSFSACSNCLETSILGLYPPSQLTTGFDKFTISNNSFSCTSSTGAALVAQNSIGNCHFRGNTVRNGLLLAGGGFGNGIWPSFTVDDTTFTGPNSADISGYGPAVGTVLHVAKWTNSHRLAGTSSYGDKYDFFELGPNHSIVPKSDVVYLNANSDRPTAFAVIDPAALRNYPAGFTTLVVAPHQANWKLKADPAWNTFGADIPVIVGGGVTLRFNGTKFDQVP